MKKKNSGGRPKKTTDTQRYNVTLSKKIVDEAEGLMLGAKLSPIINSLLFLWTKRRTELEEMLKKLNEVGKE